MPSAATIAGSASGTAKSCRMKARPKKRGCRDRARATNSAGTTERSVESDRLPEREADDAQQVGIEGGPGARKVVGAFDEQAGKRAADQQCDSGKRDDAGGDAGVMARRIAYPAP